MRTTSFHCFRETDTAATIPVVSGGETLFSSGSRRGMIRKNECEVCCYVSKAGRQQDDLYVCDEEGMFCIVPIVLSEEILKLTDDAETWDCFRFFYIIGVMI